VDDEEGIRETLPELLRQRGFDVRVAATVPEALSEIRTHDFDVLLSDLNIGKDGWICRDTSDAKGSSQLRYYPAHRVSCV